MAYSNQEDEIKNTDQPNLNEVYDHLTDNERNDPYDDLYWKLNNEEDETPETSQKHHGLIIFLSILLSISIIVSGIDFSAMIQLAKENHTLRKTISEQNNAKNKSKEKTPYYNKDPITSIARTSIVLIHADTTTMKGDVKEMSRSSGSGVILSKNGYIVTCQHVVEGAQTVTVRLPDNRVFAAKTLGYDENSDIALLKIDADNLVPVKTGTTDETIIGKKTYVIGHPGGNIQTVQNEGIAFASERPVLVDNTRYYLLETTNMVSPGDSGGGVFDVSGNLIGIIESSAKEKESDNNGFCCAVPIERVLKVVTAAKKYNQTNQ